MEEEESLYGKDVIVGNKEDAAKAADGRDVQIKTSTTQTIKMKTEGEAAAGTEDNQDTGADEQEVTTEQKLEGDIKNQLQAEEDAKADLKGKGVDFDAIAAEYENDGELSAATLVKLQKAGYPKSVVDAYITGMEATAARFESQVYDYAGGKQQFERLSQFVAAQGQGMMDTFNRVLATGDLMQIKIALQGFQAQMGQKYGTAGRSVMGSGSKATVQGFQTKAEMTTAMSDPRYGRDPQYTKEVQYKTMRSSFMR